jgi:hypothetical protein
VVQLVAVTWAMQTKRRPVRAATVSSMRGTAAMDWISLTWLESESGMVQKTE